MYLISSGSRFHFLFPSQPNMLFIGSCLVAFLSVSVSGLTEKEYDNAIKFYVWNSKAPSERKLSSSSTTAAEDGCDEAGKFAFIVHGWMEGVITPWIPITVANLLQYRTGCVYVIDYSTFSNTSNYFALTPHFKGIENILTRKMRKVGNFDRQYFFGFSFGSRLCVGAAQAIGKQMVDRMDLCDPAGPGFNMYLDPTSAAKNVGCIHTSSDKGTYIYNCHQNFRMGYCGYSQAGAGPYPKGSHGLCPYFYNLAFENDFVYNNLYRCHSARMLVSPPNTVKMGYRAEFNRTLFRGDIFCATAKSSPYAMAYNLK